MSNNLLITRTPGPWTVTAEQHDTLGDPPRLFVRGAQQGLTRPLVVHLDERDEANARLIAAAPELLAALKGLLFAPATRNERRLMEAAEAAIAKAEGKQS